MFFGEKTMIAKHILRAGYEMGPSTKPAEASMECKHQQLVSSWMSGPLLPREKLVESLEALIAPADRIVLEGDNQKQADFLSRSPVKVDPEKLHDLHLIISSISRPEHLTLFELGIAKKVDFAFAGPQSLRVAQLLEDGVLEIGAIHTYVELYARLLVDLAPNVVLVCAEQADSEGNLYTGPGTEDTPVIVEAAAFERPRGQYCAQCVLA
jgi:malonate decarboxylase alpha subunit